MPAPSPAFLFTDVEGSSRLWERHPEPMSRAMARHDALCRAAVESAGGRVVKITGDGVHAVFGDAARALEAAVAIQQGVRAIEVSGLRLRVRAAVHAGAAEERDGDYFGPTVNRAARLADSASPGQVLVSGAVAAVVEGLLVPPFELRPLGRLRLRDLSQPEAVFDVVHPGLEGPFPPPRSLETAPNNLPSLLTSLVGRRREVADIRTALDRARLVTLVGPGGIGKTRLALQAAAELLDAHPDGVWLAELSALQDDVLVPATVVRALGLAEVAGQTPAQRLAEHLKPLRTLVILDTCEHLLDACAHLADALLRAAPGLRILATSRATLDVDGEAVFPVPGLPMPDPDFPSGAKALLEIESARLFVERATLHDPAFTVDDATAPVLARIAYRLDGIPLAIELAAARLRTMSLADIDHGLDDRFGLLAVGSRVAPPRHKTLKALLDWSWQLLDPPRQRLYERLSVFAGGGSIEAAEAVCGEPGGEPVAPMIASLVRESLVVRSDAPDGSPRWRYLDTLREHAAARLEQRGEAGEIRRRHARWVAAHFARLEPRFTSATAPAALAEAALDRDNLRAALGALARDEEGGLPALALCAHASRFWYRGGSVTEGRRHIEEALAHRGAQSPTLQRARSLHMASVLAYLQGDFHSAVARAEDAIAIARALGDPKVLGQSLLAAAFSQYITGGYGASRAFFEEGIDLLEAAGDLGLAAHNLTNLAANATYAGDFDAAARHIDRAQALAARDDDVSHVASVWHARGVLAGCRGEHDQAVACMERFLDFTRSGANSAMEGVALFSLGHAMTLAGRPSEARGLHAESIPLLRRAGLKLELVNAVEASALAVAHEGRAEESLRLHEAARRVREQMGFPIGAQARGVRERVDRALAEAMDESERRRLAGMARPMSLDELADYALELLA